MNWDAVGDIGGMLGAIGVILSLCYVAVQIRQSWKATRAATVHGVNTSIANAWRPFANPNNATMYLKGLEGIACLSPEERVHFFALMHVVAKTWEDTWFQWRVGTLADTYWEGQQNQFRDIFSQSGPQEYWMLRKHWFDVDFREYLENTMDTHDIVDMRYSKKEPQGVID
jgi:hypothetical protein